MTAELARRAAAGDMAPEVLVWVRTGLARHLAGDDLEQAMGLDRASRLRQRNQALQEAAALLAPVADPWPAAGRLAEAVRHYQDRTATPVQRDPARALSPLDTLLCSAYAIRIDLTDQLAAGWNFAVLEQFHEAAQDEMIALHGSAEASSGRQSD